MDVNIITRLSEWGIDRHITIQTPNKIDYCANITEELGEWLIASKDNDADEMIDAVADICVFTITELLKSGQDCNPMKTIFNGGELYSEWVLFRQGDDDSSRNEFVYEILQLLGRVDVSYEVLYSITYTCLNKMITMGYDPILVMVEVCKVLESRTGEWDNENGKFQKDKREAAIALWHTPNYESARFS